MLGEQMIAGFVRINGSVTASFSLTEPPSGDCSFIVRNGLLQRRRSPLKGGSSDSESLRVSTPVATNASDRGEPPRNEREYPSGCERTCRVDPTRLEIPARRRNYRPRDVRPSRARASVRPTYDPDKFPEHSGESAGGASASDDRQVPVRSRDVSGQWVARRRREISGPSVARITRVSRKSFSRGSSPIASISPEARMGDRVESNGGGSCRAMILCVSRRRTVALSFSLSTSEISAHRLVTARKSSSGSWHR